MKNICATAILMSAAIISFSAVAGEKAKPDSNRTPQVKKLSFEQQRDVAIQQISEFEKKARETDPDALRKIKRLGYTLPLMAETFPPEQWRKQIEFLYLSIAMIDAIDKQDDPETVLSKYFSDEEKRAPNDISKVPNNERQTLFERRFDELEKKLDAGRV